MGIRLKKDNPRRPALSQSSNPQPKDPVVAKKKDSVQKISDPIVIEEPVTIRVTRTTKKKALGDPQIVDPTITQENPGQPADADGGESTEVDLDTIEVRRFLVEPARVNFHYTLKRSVFFQGVDVGCSVTIPCYKEEIQDAFEEAKELVAERLKIENRKTPQVLDHLIDLRIKKEQELARRGIG